MKTPQNMTIYTRTGDTGTTSLYGGLRGDKDHPQVEVCGSIDELSASLGIVRAEGLPPELNAVILRIQQELTAFCTEIVSDKTCIFPEHLRQMEAEIDHFESELPPLNTFVLPGINRISAALHLSRTICRRAERHLTAFLRNEKKNPVLACYLNRLSDFLFVMARKEELR